MKNIHYEEIETYKYSYIWQKRSWICEENLRELKGEIDSSIITTRVLLPYLTTEK